MSATADPQTSIYETTIDNPELQTLLERRQTAKDVSFSTDPTTRLQIKLIDD